MGGFLISTMAMMAFVAIIGPMARHLGLAPWQVGLVVTAGGVCWVLCARRWGALSDRIGRRPVLLAGVAGFAVSYAAMCALLIVSLQVMPGATLVFVGLLLTRCAVGACYAAMPAAGMALLADQSPPEHRARAMATLGAANGVGLVLGPALAGMLAQYGMALPLIATALLPILALVLFWRRLPVTPRLASAPPASQMRLTDARLRQPLAVAFIAMFCVTIAQMVVGFYAIDRLGLAPAAAAQAAATALTLVGVALIATQLVVRRVSWSPRRLVLLGTVVSAAGFAGIAAATTVTVLGLAYFVAAAGMGFVFPAFSAMAANAVEPHEQGATAGSVGAAQGLGTVVGPLMGTALYEIAPSVPYLVAAALLLAVALATLRRPARVPT